MKTETLRRINRYIKKENIESKVVSPPQLYVHDGIPKIAVDGLLVSSA